MGDDNRQITTAELQRQCAEYRDRHRALADQAIRYAMYQGMHTALDMARLAAKRDPALPISEFADLLEGSIPSAGPPRIAP